MLPETFTNPFREIKLFRKGESFYTKIVIVQLFAGRKSATDFIRHTKELWHQVPAKEGNKIERNSLGNTRRNTAISKHKRDVVRHVRKRA